MRPHLISCAFQLPYLCKCYVENLHLCPFSVDFRCAELDPANRCGSGPFGKALDSAFGNGQEPEIVVDPDPVASETFSKIRFRN